MKPVQIDELPLIRSAQRGDLDAFNQLLPAYQDFLFRIALNILADEDAAADATQEALISAFRNIRSFRGSVLRSWLTRMVINSCYDQLRRQHRHPTLPLDHMDEFDHEMDAAPWLADGAPLPEDQVQDRELQRQLHAGLQSLAPAYRSAAILVDIEGLSYEEAADVLRIPVGTVKSRLARARMALRGFLSREAAVPPFQTQPRPATLRLGGVA
jgi:RNA polymerase sigma-70 factor (ECF subfamily)